MEAVLQNDFNSLFSLLSEKEQKKNIHLKKQTNKIKYLLKLISQYTKTFKSKKLNRGNDE